MHKVYLMILWCFCNSLYDEEPNVLDVDADERAGGRCVHERPGGGDSIDNLGNYMAMSSLIFLESSSNCIE